MMSIRPSTRVVFLLCLLLSKETTGWIVRSGGVAEVPSTSSLRSQRIEDEQSSSHPSTLQDEHSSTRHNIHTKSSSHQNTLDLGSTRRQWLVTAATSTLALQLFDPSIAHALPPVVTPATCDATVSVFQRGNRIIYLLGTAHISQVSADLARTLVRDAHPNAVFVELDLKRVGGLLRGNESNNGLQEYVPEDSLTASMEQPPRILVPTSASTSVSPPPDSTNAIVRKKQSDSGGGGWFQRQLLGVAAASVGKALRGMYNNLGESGFSPGEEFRVAMEEARLSDATIVLGDQDVEITLKRLTQALGQTDFKSLQTPEMEAKLSGLLGTNALPPVREDYATAEAFKENLAAYVERLKSRENVRAIMSSLNEVAPALVQVMLTERDLYMANGLDAIHDFDVTVAVMGIAHQDGVEANLQKFGWKTVTLPCP